MIPAPGEEVPTLHDVLPDGIRLTRFCDIAILTVSSSATVEQAVALFTRLARRHGTPRLLWDLRGSRLAQRPAEARDELLSRLMREAPSESKGRSAFVVSGDEDCRAISTFVMHAQEAGFAMQLRVFREDRDALDWLFGRASASAPSPQSEWTRLHS